MGTVYLLHFARPYRHARHYLGYAEDLAQRLARHRSGNGARLLEVIMQAGIAWEVARTWSGDRALERRLKRWHGSGPLCPICQAEQHGRPAKCNLLGAAPAGASAGHQVAETQIVF